MRSISRHLALFGIILGLSACAAPARLTPPAARLTPTPSRTVTPQPSPSATPTPLPTRAPLPTPTVAPAPTPTPAPLVVAVIGDYGATDPAVADVAALVKSWQPALVITLGDNNYPNGSAETLPLNTAPYADYIAQGRFYPALGNHDYYTDDGQPYFDFFNLPGNERYYDFVQGPVHFFALNSDGHEPDGISAASAQARWLQERLAASTTPWQIVYFHAPAVVSRAASAVAAMDWPFAAWGADAVLTGHAHVYERLEHDGIPYIVNGLGGQSIYRFDPTPAPGSQVRYHSNFAALRLTAAAATLRFQFISRSGEMIDDFQLNAR